MAKCYATIAPASNFNAFIILMDLSTHRNRWDNISSVNITQIYNLVNIYDKFKNYSNIVTILL